MSEQQNGYREWSILELMGHRRLGGFVTEATLAGGSFLRIDVPGDNEGETHSTQYYPPASVYCLTPVSEEAARIVARSSRPEPVSRWELPQPKGTQFDCPQCGLVARRMCHHCDQQHPCECMTAAENEQRDSRRDYAFAEDGRTDSDDF